MTTDRRMKITKIVTMHYVKLVFRTILFLSALGIYVYNRMHNTGEPFSGLEKNRGLLLVIWIAFATGMILRLFPVKLESMGCQKQFKRHYIQREDTETVPPVRKHTAGIVALVWLSLNGAIGGLYQAGLFDRAILLLLVLFYSVCDVICILFFCPFQTWIMKNKCCTTCRIYNWDYAMMFTPFIFVKSIYSWSLLLLALILLVKWEYTARKHPERFSEQQNGSLDCAHCKERLCHHKVQLQGFLLKGKYNLKGNFLYKKYWELREKRNEKENRL